jgi:hypothetical protein
MIVSRSKFTRVAKLLMGIGRHVVVNIDKRLGIMQESWEIVVEAYVIAGKIRALREHLPEDL